MPTRQEIFAQAAKKLRADFDALSVVPHNQLKGNEAERLIRVFLKGHLPKRFDVTGGFMIDAKDQVSKQTDVIVYDAFNCPMYRASDEASIIPNDNVAAVVEVKATLDKEKLKEAFDNIWAAKSLAKVHVPDPGFPIMNSTLGCLIAFNSALKLETIQDHYCEFLLEKGRLGGQIDLIAILDRGGLINLVTKVPDMDGWHTLLLDGLGGPSTEGAHLGVAVQEIGADTLDYFLRFLLAHLYHFRPFAAHPGWKWENTPSKGLGRTRYIGSISHEPDPVKRKANLERYERLVEEEFKKSPPSKPDAVPGKVEGSED